MARFLPEPLSYTGRPAYTNRQLLPGILKLLRSGCRWRDLSLPDYPSGVTYWRRLRFWEEKGIFRKLFYRLLDILIMGKQLDCSVVSLDGTLIPSYEFKEVTGYSGKHRLVGVKVSVLVDKHGMPLSFSYAPGNYHDQVLSYPTLKNCYKVPRVLRSLAKIVFEGRRTLLADRGYDSLYFRRFANYQGYDPHIPSRVTVSKEKLEDPLYQLDTTLYKKRNVIERMNSWLKSFRRLHFRYDRTRKSFEACLYMVIIIIVLRRALP
jgi:transposase